MSILSARRRTVGQVVGTALCLCATAAPADTPREVTELPLDRGYYVRTDATCATASGATTALLRRNGLYWGSSFCTFQGIKQTGPTTFRVRHYCEDVRAPQPPTPIPAEMLTTAEWLIPDRTSFSFTDNNGWEHEARYCPQQEMQDEFRSGDISELIE